MFELFLQMLHHTRTINTYFELELRSIGWASSQVPLIGEILRRVLSPTRCSKVSCGMHARNLLNLPLIKVFINFVCNLIQNQFSTTKMDDKRRDFLRKIREVRLDTGTPDNPKHDYYVKGQKVGKENGYYGVTTYIGEVLFEKFNREQAINLVCNSSRYTSDPHYLYYQKTPEELIAMWDDTSVEGTDVHNIIDETLRTGVWTKLREKYPTVAIGLWMFLSATLKGYRVYASEITLVDEELKITGCIDALFYKPETNEFVLVDWKSNTVKMDAYGKIGIHPATRHLPSCKYYNYHCQVNMYAHILERHYGIKCGRLIVVGFGLDKRKKRALEGKGIHDGALLFNYFTRSMREKTKEGHEPTSLLGLVAPAARMEEENLKLELLQIMVDITACDMAIDYNFRTAWVRERLLEVNMQRLLLKEFIN